MQFVMYFAEFKTFRCSKTLNIILNFTEVNLLL